MNHKLCPTHSLVQYNTKHCSCTPPFPGDVNQKKHEVTQRNYCSFLTKYCYIHHFKSGGTMKFFSPVQKNYRRTFPDSRKFYLTLKFSCIRRKMQGD